VRRRFLPVVNIIANRDLRDLEPDGGSRAHGTARHGRVERCASESRHFRTSVLIEGGSFGLWKTIRQLYHQLHVKDANNDVPKTSMGQF
jgi:hypothetical protein